MERQNIEEKETKIGQLLVEENNHMGDNEELERELQQLNQELESTLVLLKNS